MQLNNIRDSINKHISDSIQTPFVNSAAKTMYDGVWTFVWRKTRIKVRDSVNIMMNRGSIYTREMFEN
jgi:hypothetical protein